MEAILMNINSSCVFSSSPRAYNIMVSVKYVEMHPLITMYPCIFSMYFIHVFLSMYFPSPFLSAFNFTVIIRLLFIYFAMHHITLNLHVFKNNIVVLFFPRIAVL